MSGSDNAGRHCRQLLPPLALLLLALASQHSLEAAHAGLIPDFVSDFVTGVIDAEVVCPPDSMLCPHGGRAFRDRNHDCHFTPCEFVTAPTTAPTPPPGSLRTLNASAWFRNEEFMVPRVAFRDLQRGKRVAERVARVLRHKSQRARAWAKSFAFAAAVDLVAVPAPQHGPGDGGVATSSTEEELKTTTTKLAAHSVILNEALSTGGDLALAQQGTLLVAARKPLARFAFFGWVARHPTLESVLKMLELVQDAHSLATLVKATPSNATASDAYFADLKAKVIVALPTLVVATAAGSTTTTSHGSESVGSSEPWLAGEPIAAQAQVFAFLERQLKSLGIVEHESERNQSSEPASARYTGTRAQNASHATPLASKAEMTTQTAENATADAARPRNTSLTFTAGYRGVSASIGAFLTPLASLVGVDRQSNRSDNVGDIAAAATGTFAENASALWNFTMLRCDVFEELLRKQPGIPFTVVRALSTPRMVRPSPPSQPPREQQQESGGDGDSVATAPSFAPSSATPIVSSVVFSCWVYQRLEDEHALPPSTIASSIAAVRFEQQLR